MAQDHAWSRPARDGPGENQPGTFTGRDRDGSVCIQPQLGSHTARPMAGIRTATGTERATTAGAGTV